MGFCRRCGEIVSGDNTRCKCGGTSRDSTTKILFGEKASDKWSQRYLARSNSPTSQNTSNPTTSSATTESNPLSSASTSHAPPPRPPPSPSKLAHSFLRQSESEDTELSCVFGSVLSPKDHWQCSSCQVKFRQEEVIYPHPDAKHDPTKLGELYYCRKCFAERFSLGNCKKCKLAVLSDAKFIKHEKNFWHEPCYVCSYCPNLSRQSIVIDFAARPSCEDCFDSFAYKTAGILPSPHLSQSEWSKLPIEAPPPPSKWGRPSMSGSTSVWSSRPQVKKEENSIKIGGEKNPKGAASRLKQERENSPLVQSYDELGDKLKRFGLTSSTAIAAPPSNPTASKPSARPTITRSPVTSSFGSISQSKTLPTKSSTDKHIASALDFTSPRRAALQPVQPVQHSSASFIHPASPSKTAAAALSPSANDSNSPPVWKTNFERTTTNSSRALTPLNSNIPSIPSKPSPINDQENCPACSLALGYGQFVELPSGTILHFDCFACERCRKPIAGKYVEDEGKAYHKECAPAPKRYRAIVTSLADKERSSSATSTSSNSPDSIKPNPLTTDLLPDEPVCTACSGLLGYGLSVTLPRTGQSYHSTCFTCVTCSKPFEKGFVENKGLAYHEKCVPAISLVPDTSSARSTMPSSPSRTSRPPRLPTLPSFPPKHTSPAPPSPSSLPPRSLFSTRQRPPSNFGGLLICAGCSVRATEKETVPGPGGRRYHGKCLVCGMCKRALDSECRGGETGVLRCEACRKLEARRSQRLPQQSQTPQN